MKKIYLTFVHLCLLVLCVAPLQAQTEIPDTKGTDFWVMFNRNFDNSGVSLSLFITGEIATSGTVQLPDGTEEPFTVTPGAVETVSLSSSLLASAADGVEDKGIRIVAEDEVTVYGLNQKQFTTDAFIALPVDILDEDYIIMSYSNFISNNIFSSSLLGVVATQDDTEVTIVPSTAAGSRPAGEAFTVTLQEGQSYQLQAPSSDGDLTGTTVSANKDIAVFGGHTCANVPPNVTFCDHMIEQMPPTSSWGTQFVTAPLATRLAGDVFRVLAATDGTQVNIAGNNGYSESFSLDRGEFRELDIDSEIFTQINASESVLVAQFSKGDESDPSIVNGDPFMLLVPPSDQFLNSYTVTTPASGFDLNFINVIARTSDIGNVILDGAPIPESDFTAIEGSMFSAARAAIGMGTHNLSGNFPFGVSIYGFADDESYGYLGGQGLGEVAEVEEISLSIEPVINQGSEYCFTATALDGEGNPVRGIRIDFAVNGANSEEGFGITDSEGTAQFCYTPENTGEDTITASVGNVSAETTVTIAAADTPFITLDPEMITVGINEEACITATLVDQMGDPLEGIEIFIELNGTLEGSRISDENGEVEFCNTYVDSGTFNVVFYFEGGERATAVVTVTSGGGSDSVFTLVDSQTDADILQLQEGGVYTIEDLPEIFTVRADLTEATESIVFELNGPFTHRMVETNAPYALFGNLGNDYLGRIFPPGIYALSATPYSEPRGRGTAGETLTINFIIQIDAIPDDLAVLGFDLYDAVADTKIMDLIEGSVIDLGTLDNNLLSVLALTMPDFIGSLKVELNGPVTAMRVENNRPYTLFGNNSIDFYGRAFPNGSYNLMATPYTGSNAQGTAGTPLEINFEVVGTPASEGMKVYPVPFTDHVFINMKGNKKGLDVRLFDYLGQPVQVEATVEAEGLRVATSTLREGLYVMQIFADNNPVKTLKVQKVR